MMPLGAITILYEPPREPVLIQGAEGQWGDPTAHYHNLAAVLRMHTAAEISVQTGFLRDAPPGMVLVRSSGYEAMMDEIPPENRAAAAKRTIILEVDRSNVFMLLERYGFAGAIEKQRWFQWRIQPDQESGGGLHGLRELAPAIGGSCFDAQAFQSEHYCILRSNRYADLPALIVGYLEALVITG